VSNPVGSIDVEIAGSVSGLTESMARAAESVEKTTTTMGTAFEGMQHRIEHSGVLIAFAVQNMLDGQQTGIQRAMHSIALLGFAFGPVPGAIATAAALTIEHLHNLTKAAEKEVAEFQKKMGDAVNAGNVAELQRQLQDVLVGTPFDPKSGKLVAASLLVPGTFKGSLEDLKATWDKLNAAKTAALHDLGGAAEVRSLQGQLDDIGKQYQIKKQEAEALQADLDAAELQRERAGAGDLAPVKVSGGLSDEAAKKKAAAAAVQLHRALNAMFEEMDKKSEKVFETTLDDALRATSKSVQKRLEENEKAAKEEEELRRRALQAQAADVKMFDAEVAADQRRTVEEMTAEWTRGFERIQGAVETTFTQMQHAGAHAGDFMRKLGQALVADFVRGELKMLEVHLATKLAQTAADKAAAVAGKAIHVQDALSSLAASASKAAGEAFAAMASIPYIGPELGAVAAAASFAAVMAFGALASAAQGFDVPAGLNPVTQLHSEEMVLPAHLANAVRDMAGGGSAGGQPVHLHIHTIDAVDTARWARTNAPILGAAALSHMQGGGGGGTGGVGRRG